MPEGLRILATQNGLELNDVYVLVSTVVPYSTVEPLDKDDPRLAELLGQFTECRRSLRFPEDSFCVGDGRYILAHDAGGLMVVRDLHWEESESQATAESLFRVFDGGEIPGYIASSNLSVSFGSSKGNFTFEARNAPTTRHDSGGRMVVTSHSHDFDLLSDAIEAGNAEKLRSLITKEGADVNAVAGDRYSLLAKAIDQRSHGALGVLLELGANPDTRDTRGSLVIESAVRLGDTDSIGLLIGAGADIDRSAALWIAVEEGATDIVRFLVEAGANVSPKDPRHPGPWQCSLLDAAMWSEDQEIVQILADAGTVQLCPEVEVSDPSEASGSFYPTTTDGLFGAVVDGDVGAVRELVGAGVNISAKTAGGESILTWAVITGNPEIAQVLVDAGADVNAKDDFGEPLLFEAISPYSWGPDAEQILRILVNAGADVNARDGHGNSVLIEAMENGDPEIIQILIDAGAER